MKRTIILSTVLLVLMACGQKEVVWEEPIIGHSRFTQLSVNKVVLSDEKTAVYMGIHYPSMNWFRFAKETYIEADGKRYAAIGSDSITLGQETYTDSKTWRKNFILYFEPLPKNTAMFDLLEGMKKGDYNLFNIRPKDVILPEAEIPADFLADYPEEDVWPEMAYSEEPATIHFKALNYKPGMDTEITITHYDITNPRTTIRKSINLSDDGTGYYTTKLYYPQRLQAEFRASASSLYGSFALPLLAPGQETTVLMDMNVVADSIKSSFVGYKGYMAKFNKKVDEQAFADDKPALGSWSIKKAKTVQDIITAHDSVVNAYKEYNGKKGFTDFEKEHLFDYELRFFCLVARYADSLFCSKEFFDYIMRIRPACFFGDGLIPNADYDRVCHLFAGTDIKGKGPDLCRYLYGITQSKSGKKVQKPFIEDPYLSNLYDRVTGNLKSEIEKNKKLSYAKNVHYLDLIDVTPENILQTILDKHKGKTVVMDMWATWCGWCIKGHQEMASLKETLKNKNIVFIYLTSTSSPFSQWIRAISDIPGEHYYLTDEQNNYLSEHLFGSTGVPKYAIFDTDGNQLYTQLGWAGLEKIQTEIEKALK